MSIDVVQNQTEINAVLGEFKRDRDSLIPVLQSIQGRLGYLPPEVISAVAEHLGLSESTVYSVASFYTQFKFKPSGKNIIKVCRGTACHVGGGERILAELERQLGIKPGETTPDLQFTLDTVACIGACALSPVVTVNENIHGRAVVSKILEAVAQKKGVAVCQCP
ncbi:NADH-quinone oxidoreductase subunit NuoE [Dehalogenimonas etheniformans]|uniref:NADH-quinone oxidoreductase subunit NuoE n=1 Tax=Dehalogenimonas etheniformans TaxID=1536648 RepID=A0A2P5P9W6_9CHLR|nr:NADH-quinone oxidoreductase subunit NuoE [Dehalogenimonas etheniformans]PPD59067.1 NADH-quinone oxidoreductase subunit NuoE [Dehalogenimonas etheniformans]QNT76456.1 NADH-quinone oxidoreductase subunit NuoE [Dehalogenimonas etheniformans]